MFEKYYSNFDALSTAEYEDLMLEMEINELEDKLHELKIQSDKLLAQYNELFAKDNLNK